MKLAKDTLLEIMSILQDGIINGTDVTQAFRDLDLDHEPDSDLSVDDELHLSEEYLKSKGR